MKKRNRPVGETVPLDFVSRWPGLSPGSCCGHSHGQCGFPCHGKPCSKPAAESIRSRLRHCLWPAPASGRRSCAVEQGDGKARRRSDAVPSCGVRRGWVGRSRGRHLIGDTLWLPSEMETSACGGCRDRRCEKPVQLRSTSFHGQVESAELRGAFRLMHGAVKLRVATCPLIPAVRGGSAWRKPQSCVASRPGERWSRV